MHDHICCMHMKKQAHIYIEECCIYHRKQKADEFHHELRFGEPWYRDIPNYEYDPWNRKYKVMC